MNYPGSKRRLFKHIFPIMEKELKPGDYVVDLFCGGGNFIDKVPTKYKRIANDKDDIVLALQFIRDHVDELPKNNKEFTKEDYYFWKNYEPQNDYEKAFKAFVARAYSFGGTKWGSWAHNNAHRDYVEKAYRNAVKQSPLLKGITFYNLSYEEVPLPEPDKCVIYCDPPYKNVSKYAADIDHQKFYDWLRQKKKEGYRIFISEYNMPNDFKCVFEKPIKMTLKRSSNSIERVERLYTL